MTDFYTGQDRNGVSKKFGMRVVAGETDIYAQYAASDSEVLGADGQPRLGVSTTKKTFTDCFSGSAIDATLWETITDTGGMTKTVSASTLTVGMGTTNGAELILRSVETFTIPTDIRAILSLSQRLAANQVRISLIEVDATTLAAVAHASLSGDYKNRASMYFGNTTTAARAELETISEDSSVLAVNTTASQSLTTGGEYAMVVRPQDVFYHAQAKDVVTAPTATALRLSSQVPHPGRLYKLQLHFKNGSTPATNTNVVISRIACLDIDEIAVTLSTGRTLAPAAVAPVGGSGSSAVTQYAEDAAHGSGDSGIGALGVRKDTAASLAGTDGDYTLAIYDSVGRLHTRIGAIDANEGHIGEVAGSMITVSVTPTISTSAYAADDVVGGIITLSAIARATAKSGYITYIDIVSKTAVAQALDIILFKATPASGTYTDNGALTLSAGDEANILGHARIDTWRPLGGTKTVGAVECRIPFQGQAGTDLFILILTRGAFTPGTTSDWTLKVTADNN